MRKLAIWVIPLLILALVVGGIGCGGTEPTAEATPTEGEPTQAAEATPTPTPTTPASFTTFTRPELFSISYPSHWASAKSEMDEIFEEVKEALKSENPDVSVEEMTMLFLGGEPNQDGYYPFVNVLVTPRSAGYWTLDEVVESEDAYGRTYTPGYQVISRTKTIVDGREAVIDDTVDNEPGYGKWRYLQMIMVKDELVWLVSCGCEHDDFKSYEDTFEDIVRSLRILG